MSIDQNLIQIRQKVYDAIADLLGEYTSKTKTGNVTSKAITVLPHLDLDYEYPLAGTGLSGLECVIMPTDIRNQEGMGDRMIIKTYLIMLFQYDRNKGVTEACDRLLSTDLQFINNSVNINVELPKAKSYKTALLTVRFYALRSLT